jgi:two-component system LytT family response regulator
LDYLLKPINYIDLLGAVTRYENKSKKESQQKQFNVLLENIDTGDVAHKKMAISTDTGIEFVKYNSIIFLEAQNNYTKINLIDGTSIIASKTLKYFEELLPSQLFFRIHKTYLINMNFVKRFFKIDDFQIELTTGDKLPVSLRKKESFLNAIVQKD